jgi:hypothetical protein
MVAEECIDALSGAVVSSITSSAVSKPSKIREALFLPAAKVIGDHWAEGLKGLFEKNREKREENVQIHMRVASKLLSDEELERVVEDSAFGEWAEGASRVDPEDEALAGLWRAAYWR